MGELSLPDNTEQIWKVIASEMQVIKSKNNQDIKDLLASTLQSKDSKKFLELHY